MSSAANDTRPACRRCKSTGKVKGQTYACGVCFDCGGRGHGPSVNDKISTLTEVLENITAAGKEVAARIDAGRGRQHDPKMLTAHRAEYRRVRDELRALGARA